METLFGLPKKVIFCNRCVISNQRPSSTIEFLSDASEVKKTLDIHMSGEDKDNLIWPMLMLELWARNWLD